MSELQMVWNWQPALYLFLGGMGAGAFIMATILFIRDKDAHKKTIATTLWASALCLIVGLILLVTELTFPLRGFLLWQSFSNLASWMALGAWIIFVAVIVFVIAAILSTEKFYALIGQKEGPAPALQSLRAVFMYVGAVCGVCVAVYTGILLFAAPGIPLWNSPLLPVLFTVSALATGAALVELILVANAKKEAIPKETQVFFGRFVVVAVLVELVVMVILLATMSAGDLGTGSSPASVLISGALAPCFWILFVCCGLVVPFITSFLSLRKLKQEGSSHSSMLTRVGALLELVGGCALRFLILMAGLHADLVASAAMQIIG